MLGAATVCLNGPKMTRSAPADLFACFDALGIAHETYRHPPVFTVEESAKIKLSMPGGHTKNLFLKDKRGGVALLCALADTKIDLNATGKLIGMGRLSFGAPDLLMDALGVTPGSVTIFALINDPLNRVRLLLDAALLAHNPVNFHPLSNDATTAIDPRDLLRFLDTTGHRPTLLAFDKEGSPSLIEGHPLEIHLGPDQLQS
jgi:Ala-tRNA(Pro) deacylase